MRVSNNGLVYDSNDERCQMYIGTTGATLGHGLEIKLAFITVMEGDSKSVRRYFGAYDVQNPESSIRQIIERGGKWPYPFSEYGLPAGVFLEN